MRKSFLFFFASMFIIGCSKEEKVWNTAVKPQAKITDADFGSTLGKKFDVSSPDEAVTSKLRRHNTRNITKFE